MNNDFPRIKRLPPYVFNITNELKMAARHRGEDIIDLSMGNPDGDTPKHIVDKMVEVAQRPGTQTFRYFFPSIPFDSQQNDPALLRRKFFNMEIQLTDDLFFHCQCINHILVLPTYLQHGNLEYCHESDYCVYIIRYYYNRHDKD